MVMIPVLEIPLFSMLVSPKLYDAIYGISLLHTRPVQNYDVQIMVLW